MSSVHAELSVYVEATQVVVDAPSGDDDICLRISRPDGACALVPRPAGGWGGGRPPEHEAVGIVGLLTLASGAYLMLVINRKRAARASGYEIWQATGFEVIALGEPHKLPGRVLREERELVRGVKKHILGCRCLYLSYEHDITHTAQRIATRVQRAQPLWRRAEPRFFFNRHAVEPLISACADRWVLPLLLGFVHHHEGVLNGRAFDVLTIARRSSRRAGVRFHQRGLGGSGCGEVAHLVESEQVLLCMGRLQSHVQLRGSIPLTWWQPPQLMVADPHRSIVLAEGKAGVAGCAAHVSWLLDEYGPELSVVSLVNESKGAEIALGHALARELTRMGEALVTYVPFDFHAVCSGGRLERISLLLEQLGEALGRHGAFEQELQPTGAPPLPPRAGSANTLALPEAQHTLSAFPPRSGSANSLAASHDGRMAERTATERAAKSRARTAPPSPPASTAGMEEKGEGEEPPPTAVGTAAAACAVGKLPLWTNFSLLPPARLRDGCARGRILSVQFGVVRTNCVDCQDRTNVAQAEVGMLVLQAQLRHAKVLLPHETLELHRVFHAQRRCVWADHGDAHSILYSGTPAVKGDFVRTGKRSLHGQARDVLNSLTRFVRNNLSDGERQDAYDLFLGGYSLSPARRPTDSLYAAPARTTLLAYAVRCVLAGLVLLAVATVACAQMCEAAEGMAGPEMPFRMRTVASACAWSEVQVHAQWRVGQLLPLLLYLRWCYAALCADVRRFVDMPRLLPAEYEPPAGALVLGSKTIV